MHAENKEKISNMPGINLLLKALFVYLITIFRIIHSFIGYKYIKCYDSLNRVTRKKYISFNMVEAGNGGGESRQIFYSLTISYSYLLSFISRMT